MSETWPTPGELIRLERARAGITQRELATRMGTAQSAISRVETDAVSPTVHTLERIIEALDGRLHLHVTYPDTRGAPHGSTER